MPRRVALDIGQLHFLEVYRASACRGVLRYTQTHSDWELLYNDNHFALVGKYRRIQDLANLGVEGLIVSHSDRRKLDQIRALGIPFVTLSNDFPGEDVPCVLSDDEAVGSLAAEHFLERGFHALGFCGSNRIAWDQARWHGFSRKATARGVHPLFFCAGHSKQVPDERALALKLASWLRDAPKPFGVLGADDLHAFKIIDAARRIGLRVPQDVAVVGIDNNLLVCSSTRPALSSIEQDALQVGYRAAQLLAEMMEGEATPTKPLLIPPRALHVRASSDVLATEDPALQCALAYIRDNLARSIGAEEIASAAGVSRRTLELRFRNQLHSTINHFVRARRIEKAKAVLADPHVSINEVARLCGFQTGAYFCTVFREATGSPPAEWRHREGLGAAG